MMDLGHYAVFIVAAYGLTFLVIATLVAWVVVDYRVQRRTLADLEARGVGRPRSVARG
jgi:heme exporter protein D